jgi:hypothetical protein
MTSPGKATLGLMCLGTSCHACLQLYESVLEGAQAPSLQLQSGGVPFWEYLQQPGNEWQDEAFNRQAPCTCKKAFAAFAAFAACSSCMFVFHVC